MKPWKTSRLTKILKEYTEKATGIPIGVREYRQLTIAITEKHIKQIVKPFNQYDDKTKEADIGVAFACQSGHRPLQRGISYGLDGAFPNRLQAALLEVYRWVSEEWHKFIRYEDLATPNKTTAIHKAAETSLKRQATVTTQLTGNAFNTIHPLRATLVRIAGKRITWYNASMKEG
jgi:hypothetical protein